MKTDLKSVLGGLVLWLALGLVLTFVFSSVSGVFTPVTVLQAYGVGAIIAVIKKLSERWMAAKVATS